jgi:hypothetical protein
MPLDLHSHLQAYEAEIRDNSNKKITIVLQFEMLADQENSKKRSIENDRK